MAGKRQAAAGPSQRQLRVGELIRRALSEILMRGDVAEPVLLDTVVTISEVRPSPDLRNATVYFMPLGGKNVDDVRDALERSAGYLRSRVAGEVRLKFATQLRFVLDPSFDEGERMAALLRSERVAPDLGEERDDDARDGRVEIDAGESDGER